MIYIFQKNFKKSIDKSKKVWYYIFCDVEIYAPLAQLVEHLTLHQGVQGSSP